MLTAGHCLCSKEVDDTRRSDHFCLDPSENQIVQGNNHIRIFGGSKSEQAMNEYGYPYQYRAEEAYIMDGSSDDEFDKQDIGVLQIPDDKLFFDRKALKKGIASINAPIIPICLAAMNHDVTNDVLRGVGWGMVYEEAPELSGNRRNPVYSSCMTSQSSPPRWRLQNCNMKEIKKNGWECEKKKPPPSYEKGDYEKCIDYFNAAYLHENHLKGKQIKDQHVMYIKEGNVKKQTCYQPRLLQENGWCRLQSHRNPQKSVVSTKTIRRYPWYLRSSGASWGTCSSSCSIQHMKARDI